MYKGDFPESLSQAMLVGRNVSREIGRIHHQKCDDSVCSELFLSKEQNSYDVSAYFVAPLLRAAPHNNIT